MGAPVHLECCAPVILQEAVDRYDGLANVPGYDLLEQDHQSDALQIASTVLAIDETPPERKKKEANNTSKTKEKAATNTKKHKAIEAQEPSASRKKMAKKTTKQYR